MADEEKALVPADTRQVDAYERAYMGEGTVLYRDKMVAGTRLYVFLGAIAALIFGIGAVQGTVASSLVSLPILAAFWLLFGVLRVSVTDAHVNIQYAVWGPKIPLAAIESATAIKYKWTSFGGWGIRRGPEGWMYNMIGDGGNAVKIVWRDGGERKVTFIGTQTAEELARQIDKAQRALPAAAKEEPAALTSGE